MPASQCHSVVTPGATRARAIEHAGSSASFATSRIQQRSARSHSTASLARWTAGVMRRQHYPTRAEAESRPGIRPAATSKMEPELHAKLARGVQRLIRANLLLGGEAIDGKADGFRIQLRRVD